LDTFVRTAPVVIDAEVASADGSTSVVTGTPNHPFWVDAVRDYVPLGQLEVGTVLHVQGGGEAILVSKTWRQGDFEQGSLFRVFDFEVEGLHNFYVRGSASDAAGVLVHNSSGPKLGSRVDLDAPDISVRSGGVDTTGDPSGTYTVQFGSGKQYHGKGLQDRAEASALREAELNNDTIVSVDWQSQPNAREAFKEEARRIRADGGVKSEANYNRHNSPGEKYLVEDGE